MNYFCILKKWWGKYGYLRDYSIVYFSREYSGSIYGDIHNPFMVIYTNMTIQHFCQDHSESFKKQ